MTPHGRGQIGLSKSANSAFALALSALAGSACGLAVFVLGIALFANSPSDWNHSIRDSFQIDQLRLLMPPAAVLAVIALPAMILTPITEVILFRGIIQQFFTLRWNAHVAIRG